MEVLGVCLEEQLLIKYCSTKHLILLKVQNVMDIYTDVIQYLINFLTKIFGVIKSEIMTNERTLDLARVAKFSDRMRQLAEEVHKPIIKKFEKRKVYSPFKLGC